MSVLEPTDDNSLQALTILYREMHRREYTRAHTHTRGGGPGRMAPLLNFLSSTAELVAKLYEAAVKKVPLSEEYHSHLFMAYARVGEYKKMQQVRRRWDTSTCRNTLRLKRRMFFSRLGWRCIKSCPRIRTTSGPSWVWSCRYGHTCTHLRTFHYPVNQSWWGVFFLPFYM